MLQEYWASTVTFIGIFSHIYMIDRLNILYFLFAFQVLENTHKLVD